MQIMHAVISRDFIYPRIFLIDMNKNLILFVNIYGFVRFPCNVLVWQAL